MSTTNRREFVKMCLAAAAGRRCLRCPAKRRSLPDIPKEGGTVRDRLWIFCCAANSDSRHAAPVCDDAGEGAFFTRRAEHHHGGSPARRGQVWAPGAAVCAVHGRPAPAEAGRVVGVARAAFSIRRRRGGPRSGQDSAELRRRDAGRLLYRPQGGQRAKWSVDELAQFRRRLLAINKDFKIFATYYYASQVDLTACRLPRLIDVVTLWAAQGPGQPRVESKSGRGFGA